MARLRRSDCSAPGIGRRGRGRGFEFFDERGRKIDDRETLERLAELSVPPAWEDVWICSDPMGHLQATGIDDASRKQYLYHPRWRERRDQQKFDQMVDFAGALPRMRRRVATDLEGSNRGLSRDRVLACTLRLLDRGFFRIGSEDYAEQNETYGLATMQRRHICIGDGEVVFDYEAKGGQRRVQAIADPCVLPVLERLKRRRTGEDLLAYKARGRWVEIRSEDVNSYLKEAARGDYSAKDFRTWNASVIAAVALAVAGPVPETKSARKRTINQAIAGAAAFLGNTPAVARQSYVDPRVLDRYRDGATIAPALKRVSLPEDVYDPRVQRSIERAVLRLID